MKIKWDEVGKRLYETWASTTASCSRWARTMHTAKVCPGMALSAVNESPPAASLMPYGRNNIKYLNLMSCRGFSAPPSRLTPIPMSSRPANGCAEIAPGVTIAQQDRKMFRLLLSHADRQRYGWYELWLQAPSGCTVPQAFSL